MSSSGKKTNISHPPQVTETFPSVFIPPRDWNGLSTFLLTSRKPFLPLLQGVAGFWHLEPFLISRRLDFLENAVPSRPPATLFSLVTCWYKTRVSWFRTMVYTPVGWGFQDGMDRVEWEGVSISNRSRLPFQCFYSKVVLQSVSYSN